MNRITASALVLACTGPALAAITGTSGACFQIGAPVSAFPGALPTGNQIFVWDEAQSINIGLLSADLTANPSNSSAPTPGLVAGLVDSHFVHFDAMGQANGTVTFNNPIAAVMYGDTLLDLSDFAGSGGTAYPTGFAGRGVFTMPFLNSFVDINGNVLTLKLDTISPVFDYDQVRVFTRLVPAPGSLALLAAGGAVAGRRRRA